uniref:Myb-like domain-containing protein n=1 Tax=Fagus sylvatica TaxID=28930 RepID=A0A2N9EI69_FAGSY
MFDGVSDQFHQFIASRTTLPLPPPLSFPLHASSSPNNFPPYDIPYNPSHQVPLPPNLLHPLHHQSPTTLKHEEKAENNLAIPDPILDPSWTNEEVLALLRIRSSMENWFPEFTWEHVSRKLAELGFRRSAEKCKDKFEEESRYFNNNINYSKNYRFLSELEELCHNEQNPQVIETQKNNQRMEKSSEQVEEEDKLGQSLEVDDSSGDGTVGDKPIENSETDGHVVVGIKSKSNVIKKRKREKNFEMLKGLCEKIVSKMMAQQEEMHHKLLEDMVKRDEEKVAKEEAWKKQEMDRMNKELELMAQEQAVAGDRQATIIEFLKQFSFTSFGSYCFEERHVQDSSLKVPKSSNSYTPSSSSSIQEQNPNPPICHDNNQVHQNSCSLSSQGDSITPTQITKTLVPQNPSSPLAPNTSKVPTSSALAIASPNPNSLNTQNDSLKPNSISTHKATPNPIMNAKDDLGRRWPRDEVLALINLRCSLYSNGEDKEGTKAPLWERISQGMLELGYKRSAKRCKEKWENINKYFRKTKDVNKKRSLDSRTCPYFYQLSTLYNQGTLVAPSDGPGNCLTEPENHSVLSEVGHIDNSSQGVSSNSTMHVADEGEKKIVQAPSFDFEF